MLLVKLHFSTTAIPQQAVCCGLLGDYQMGGSYGPTSLFDAKLFSNILRQGILVNQDVHRLVSHKGF